MGAALTGESLPLTDSEPSEPDSCKASGQLERRVGHGQGIFFVAQYYCHSLTPTSAPSIGFATHHERDEQV